MLRRSHELGVILSNHAVMEYRDGAGDIDLAVLEARRGVNDVVDLPLAGRPASIDERRRLSIDRSGLAIGISQIVIAIENLDFIQAHQEDAAIAASLAVSLRRRRSAPLDME